jgi:hypothetical protein
VEPALAPDDAVRAWLAAALRGAAESEVPAGATQEQVLDVADRQGAAGLVQRRLLDLPASEPLQDAFAAAARQQAAQSLWIAAEAKRLLNVLAEHGLRVLVLKGVALAWWLYPAPYLRVCGDLDLLYASRDDALRAARILADHGYGEGYEQGGHACELVRMPGPGAAYSLEVDIHWKLLNAPVFADALDFETLWQASIAVPALGEHARGLDAVHALCHAAMNRAVNLYTGVGDLLKCLCDIDLLAAYLDDEGWARLLRLATDRGLCGVVHAALEAARVDLGTQVPAQVLDAMAQAMARESLDSRRLGEWGYMQRRNAVALPLGARLRWLWGRLLPDLDYLRKLHGGPAPLPVLLVGQVKRLTRRLLGRPHRPPRRNAARWPLVLLGAGLALLAVVTLLPGSVLATWFFTPSHAPGRALLWLDKTAVPPSRWFHLLVYAWLTLCLARIFPRWRWRAVLLLLGLAVAGELAQLFVPGRTTALSDVLDDLAGIGLGMALVALARKWWASWRT